MFTTTCKAQNLLQTRPAFYCKPHLHGFVLQPSCIYIPLDHQAYSSVTRNPLIPSSNFSILIVCKCIISASKSPLSANDAPRYLKLKWRQYPAIHTNYILYHCTTTYNIIIILYTLVRQKQRFKSKNNKFDSTLARITKAWPPAARLMCPG